MDCLFGVTHPLNKNINIFRAEFNFTLVLSKWFTYDSRFRLRGGQCDQMLSMIDTITAQLLHHRKIACTQLPGTVEKNIIIFIIGIRLAKEPLCLAARFSW